jgi:hypothetical protein
LIVFEAEVWRAGHESELAAPLRGAELDWPVYELEPPRFGSSLAIREKARGVEHDKQRRVFVHGNFKPDAAAEDCRWNQ